MGNKVKTVDAQNSQDIVIDEESLQHLREDVSIQNTEAEDKSGTASVDSMKQSIAVVESSLLNDCNILRSLRNALYRDDMKRYDTIDTNSTTSTGDRVEEDNETSKDSGTQQHDYSCQDPLVTFFFKFFEFAQAERNRLPGKRPNTYFTQDLCSNLSEIRSDLEWAQDAAYRRQAGKPYVSWADYVVEDQPIPWFTYTVLAIITFAMVWTFYEDDWNIASMKINPFIGPDSEALIKVGGLKGQVLIEDGKWWLLISSIFLHAGIIHLLMNSVLFLYISRFIERNHGWFHTCLLFLLSGIFGNAIGALLQPHVVRVGASAGIYGLIGACVGDIVLNSQFFFLVLEERIHQEDLRRQRKRLQQICNEVIKSKKVVGKGREQKKIQYRRRRVRLMCSVTLAFEFFLNFAIGLLPFVDNFSHLGGFLFGFFVSLSSLRLLSASSFDYRKKEQRTAFQKWCHKIRIFALRCGGGLLALFLVLLTIIFLHKSDGTNSPCPRCRYLSCMALPKPWKPNDPSNWWTCDGCGGVQATVTSVSVGGEEIWYIDKMFCPLGNTIALDFSEGVGFPEMQHARNALPKLCTQLCDGS